MRVGLFTESYDPIINGVSTSVKTLATHLIRTGHSPIFLVPKFPHYTDAPSDWPIHRLNAFRSPWNRDNPATNLPVFGLPRVYKNIALDVVHLHHPFGLGQQAILYANRHKIPLIATFHTLYADYLHYVPFIPRPLMTKILNSYLCWFYNCCDAVIVPSRHTSRILENIGVHPSRLRVVPTGVAAAPVVEQAEITATRTRLGIPPDAEILLYVGRLAREKNLNLLLETLATLPESCHLVFVGSGPHHANLVADARLLRLANNLSERVHFAGFVPHKDVSPYYAMADIFVFPSVTETQGVVLSEAQSFGLPCVVADGGGAPESVRDGLDAFIVPPDCAAFARAIRQLLENSALQAAFSEAARTSPLRPTPEQMVARVVGIYEENRRTNGETRTSTPAE
jgi:1,2-diacylglycerol 3-alpha-glucosyltransferase